MESKKPPKILVVDDEAVVRQLVTVMLRKAGYDDVLQAEDGRAALEVLEQIRYDVALVITDIRMPRMDGCQLSTHIRLGWPHIKVLCVSGFADPLSPNGHYFLPKPFTATALIAIVRDVMDICAA